MIPRAAGRTGALVLGLALASLPFLQFGLGGGHRHEGDAHTDHAPHHGGVLQMVGDYHVEVAAVEDEVRVFVSDALRRPLRAARASARFDDAAVALWWQSSYFTATAPGEYDMLDLEIHLFADLTEETELRLGLTRAMLGAVSGALE